MINKKSDPKSGGLLSIGVATAAIGGYLLWRNRSKIQGLLASAGIIDPHQEGDAGDTRLSSMPKSSSDTKPSGATQYDTDFSAAV